MDIPNQSVPGVGGPAIPVLSPNDALTPDQQQFINKWSFGAFSLTMIYFFASGLIKEGFLMFVPFYNIYLWIKGIGRGRRMSWESGQWKSFAIFKQRQKLLDKIGIILICVWVVLFALLLWGVFAATAAPRKATEQFLTHIAAGQSSVAYSETSADFQQQTSPDDFNSWIAGNTILQDQKGATLNQVSVKNDTADVSGVLSGTDNTQESIDVQLIDEDGVWEVEGIELGDGATGQSVSSNSSDQATSTLVFNNEEYAIADQLAPASGTDYSSESYEWVTNGETVDAWTTLITTHKLSPLNPGSPLSAEVYAENVAALEQQNGATMLETSVINDANAVASGIDVSNPPYLLVYIYKSTDASQPSEFDIQRIQDAPQGGVTSIIYAQQLSIDTDQDLQSYLSSTAYAADRSAVILFQFPY